MSLSKMPSEVLASVLNNQAMPLRHRLSLRLLSTRWADIIEDGLKKESILVIRNDNSDYLEPKANDLLIKSSNLTEEFFQLLVRLFPGITELSFSAGKRNEPSASLSHVPSLLAHFATKLKTVKLYGSLGKEDPLAVSLASALNAICGLSSLALHGPNLSVSLFSHLAPVFSHLKQLSCSDTPYGSSSFLSSSLSPYCTHLMLDNDTFATSSEAFRRQLSINLTHLHLVYCRKNAWNFLSKFRQLISLTVHFYNFTFLSSSLFRRLASLTRLTKVTLYRVSHYGNLLELPTEREPPLLAIKRLTLLMVFQDHQADYGHFFQVIRQWFPHLVRLTLITEPNVGPTIQASLVQLPFSVQLLDSLDHHFDLPSF